MPTVKHYLADPPTLSKWLTSAMPEPGTLVWLDDGVESPVLIGNMNLMGGVCDDCPYGPALKVLAYACIDLDALTFIDA